MHARSTGVSRASRPRARDGRHARRRRIARRYSPRRVRLRVRQRRPRVSMRDRAPARGRDGWERDVRARAGRERGESGVRGGSNDIRRRSRRARGAGDASRVQGGVCRVRRRARRVFSRGAAGRGRGDVSRANVRGRRHRDGVRARGRERGELHRGRAGGEREGERGRRAAVRRVVRAVRGSGAGERAGDRAGASIESGRARDVELRAGECGGLGVDSVGVGGVRERDRARGVARRVRRALEESGREGVGVFLEHARRDERCATGAGDDRARGHRDERRGASGLAVETGVSRRGRVFSTEGRHSRRKPRGESRAHRGHRRRG